MALPTVLEVDGDYTLLVRTDYADEAAWQSLLAQVSAPSKEGFVPLLKVLDNRVWENLGVRDIAAWARGALSGIVFVADEMAIKASEKTLLVVNVATTPGEDFGRAFRVVASEVWGPENNLRIANMEFRDFADAADETGGVHRGFSR